MQLGAEAIAAGHVAAIAPYLKVLDRLDRYQAVAGAEQVYDDEARKKLMDKINRMAENFGIDEDFAAAVDAHLKKTGKIPNDQLGETDGPKNWRTRPRSTGGGKRGVQLDVRLSPARNLRGELRGTRFFDLDSP